MSRKTKIVDDIPTYKEMEIALDREMDESLTPITSEYLLKDRSKMDDVFRKIVGHLNSLRTDRIVESSYINLRTGIGKAGVSVISAMEPADAQNYIDERLDTLGLINEYVTDMMEDLESDLEDLLNSYQDDTTSMRSLEGESQEIDT